jgi:hypothetical protein
MRHDPARLHILVVYLACQYASTIMTIHCRDFWDGAGQHGQDEKSRALIG